MQKQCPHRLNKWVGGLSLHTTHTNCATNVSGVTTCTCAGAPGGVIGCVAGNGVDGSVTVEDVLALATANTQTQLSSKKASKCQAGWQGVTKHTGNSRASPRTQPNFYT